ncbi:MAG: hypothetical protein MZW92_18215 [Comamonadaceae bacterium]|nr:hypothetical protein [Comamonadaceae bacterium]
MSLLMDALKQAEEAKRLAEWRRVRRRRRRPELPARGSRARSQPRTAHAEPAELPRP